MEIGFVRRDIVPSVRRSLAAAQEATKEVLPGALASDAEFLALARSEGENPLDCFDSEIPRTRQLDILERHFSTWEQRRDWKARYQQERTTQPFTEEDLREPQWATVATARPTVFMFDPNDEAGLEAKKAQLDRHGLVYREMDDPETGTKTLWVYGPRVMLAFYKTPCPFQCTYCTLPGANDPVRALSKARSNVTVTPETQFAAYHRALEITQASEHGVPVIEVLNDGSWYSDREIPPATRALITNDVAARGHVQTLAVESRPEYIDTQRIRTDLSHLRPDQKLTIYIGLETTDDFVATVVKKWYGWAEFDAAVRRIASLPPQDRRRVKVVAYNIMKQWCTTEREALEESVRFVQKVTALSEEVGIEIEVKHEPTIVSRGTDQHFFFHQIGIDGERMYKNLSYFTVAELVARLHSLGLEKCVAFGQRDDIDDIEIHAMVARLDNELLHSPLDFIAYDAVQQFQTDGNFEAFVRMMAVAMRGQDGEADFTPEFLQWEREVYGGEASTLRQCTEKLSGEAAGTDEGTRARIMFSRGICDLVQKMEQDEGLKSMASLGDDNGLKEAIGGRFAEVATRLGYEPFLVTNVIPVDVTRDDVGHGDPASGGAAVSPSPRLSGYQVEMVVRYQGTPSSVWLFISR